MFYETKYNDEIITYSVIQRECDNISSISLDGVFDDPRAYDEFTRIFDALRTSVCTGVVVINIDKPKSYMIRMCRSLLLSATSNGGVFKHNNLTVISFLAIATYVFEHTRYFYTNTKDGSNAPKA